MSHINIEIKARLNNADKVREILKSKKARFVGLDHQIDTYFKIPSGKLKLREGNIENYLIHYKRENKKGPKQSDVSLFEVSVKSPLKNLLSKAIGTSIVVDKRREIYFINNIKFHIDKVKGLGSFIEIEAIDKTGKLGKKKILKQCQEYLSLLRIKKNDLISSSYSDLL